MKCKDFRSQLLLPAADFLSAGGAVESAQSLRDLATVFEVLPPKSVADVSKRLNGLQFQGGASGHGSLGGLIDVLTPLGALMVSMGKQPAAKDIDLVCELLSRHRGAPIEAFALAAIDALTSAPATKKATKKPLREDLVARYHRHLEQALGDDPGFAEVYDRLTTDPDMGSAEITLLAQRFSLAKARSRDAALKKILARHQALMTSRARSAATAGRIAG